MTESDAARARAERKASKRGKQRRRQEWRNEMRGDPDRVALNAALASLPSVRRGPRAAPIAGKPQGRWVPIGPSVVQFGQAIDRPRVTGRINDLAVESTLGRRAYAASGNGGVWYTEDAGASWVPVGPWAERARESGGRTSANAGGSILVEFGATAKDDVVLVGTGEFQSIGNPDSPSQGGVGILSAVGPTVLPPPLLNPWEPDTNSLAMMEGVSVNRLVRQPGRTAGATSGPTRDRIAAATSMGLYIGERKPVAAAGGYPDRGTYDWTPALMDWPAVPAKWMPAGTRAGAPRRWPGLPNVTDVVWLPGGRLVLAINGFGVVLSDDEGETLYQVPSMDLTTQAIGGRISLTAVDAKRVYVLYTNRWNGPGLIRQIADATLETTKPAPVTAAALTGVPALFGSGQGDYDQCIVADRAPVAAADDLDGTNDGLVDRLYLGGDTLIPAGGNDYCAALWIMDVRAGRRLASAPKISRTGVPPNGAGATNQGLVGNNVHPDVHVIRLAGPASNRTVWVGCDGGVFVSTQGGRVHTFAPRVNGLATLEPGFLATHPTSPQFIAAGVQDNGVLVRTGDTVWEEHFEGDGGGVAFHPTVPDVLIGQWTQGTWQSTHPSFRDPLQRRRLHPNFGTIGKDREDKLASFYCGAAAVAKGANGRIAVGTNRVWLTDDLGGARGCTWVVLPFVTKAGGAPAVDPRTSAGADRPNQTRAGVPFAGPPVVRFTKVHTIKWVSDSELLAVYPEGICRWTETGVNWQAKLWPLSASPGAIPPGQTITDVAPIPGTQDFYVSTLGVTNTDVETVWLYSHATDTFSPTKFRHQLDTAGPTLGPLDPAYAIVVDPGPNPGQAGNTRLVYVGTATGVWVGELLADGTHRWEKYDNGLPQATVQDLSLWTDPPPLQPGARTVRMLRAAVQSRGVWEVDLHNPAARHTYVRVHQYDDRRTLPVSLANPRRLLPGTPPRLPAPPAVLPTDSSPDITVRPRWPMAAIPRWLGPNPIRSRNVPSAYELWLFQTAFRWLYPSVTPTGTWTQAFGDLVALERTKRGPMLPAVQLIDKQLWDAVVGTRLAADLSVSASAADQLAVASPPWITPLTPKQFATEIDLLETVVPPSATGGVWTVYSEPSSVDVLLHHRDSRPVEKGRAWAVLLWQYVANAAAGLTATVTDVTAFHDKVWKEQPSTVDPSGWTVVRRPDGSARHPLDEVIDARMPRAVSFDVDLTPPTAPAGPQPPAPAAVVFLALVGSMDDDPRFPPPAATTVNDLVTQWPHAAARVCLLQPRP